MWLQVENQKYQDDLNVYINGVYKNVHLFECMLSWIRGENKYVGSSQHRSWQTGREGDGDFFILFYNLRIDGNRLRTSLSASELNSNRGESIL